MAFSVRYMGSKRALAETIGRRISGDYPEANVLDLFAGMCAIGAQLAPRHTVFTNDAQSFASIVAEALFISGAPPTPIQAVRELLPAYRENKRCLETEFKHHLAAEDAALAALVHLHSYNDWKAFVAYNNEALAQGIPDFPASVCASKYRDNPRATPYVLATAYFKHGYFGVRQAIEIDSLRYAIDHAGTERRAVYLSALMHAASHCAAAPGHFAQYLTPRDSANTAYVAKVRRRSITKYFADGLLSFPKLKCKGREGNRVYCSDAISLLIEHQDDFSGDNLVIYADPPYSRAQYSRYYHVLETIARYDYPDCVSKGRYRQDRFRTGFSLKAGVIREMNRFSEAAANTGAPLYISYPSNGLLYKAGGNLEATLRQYYPRVDRVASMPLAHSTLGGAPGSASVVVMEEVFHAKW